MISLVERGDILAYARTSLIQKKLSWCVAFIATNRKLPDLVDFVDSVLVDHNPHGRSRLLFLVFVSIISSKSRQK